MPTRPLPNDPSLEHLRKQAKRLRNAVREGEAQALARVREFHPRADTTIATFSLTDAQLVTARSYGFASWTRLKEHLAEIEPYVWNPPPASDTRSPADAFIRLACLTYSGDWNRSNPAKARRMLTDHPEIATADIYAAAASGDVGAVRGMVDRRPELVDATGGPLRWAPLLYACYSRLEPNEATLSTLAVARLLLSRGGDPNAGFLFSGSYAFTALTGAFGRGEDWHNQLPHPECNAVARLLLDAGADPNDAQTLYNRHFEPDDDHLRILLEYGLGKDQSGPWLKRLNDPRITPGRLLTDELWSAAAKNFPDRVKLLVGHGVDISTPGLRDGRTPYEAALRAGNSSIAQYLLEHGARKVELDPLETFALACIAGRREEVHDRLAREPALFAQLGYKGQVELLHRAVDSRNRDGIRLTVALGADINGMIPGTGHDRAVLHNAAGFGGLDMVKFLLSLGADSQLRDLAFQSTPIGWAYHSQQHEVVVYLLQYANIFDAVRCDGVERVGALLRGDPSLANARDDKGHPLILYVHPEMERLRDMLRLLVAHGADVNVRAEDGQTFLDHAIARGLSDFADTLREYGARTAAELTATS
jgi:ankyrin repeat protein